MVQEIVEPGFGGRVDFITGIPFTKPVALCESLISYSGNGEVSEQQLNHHIRINYITNFN
jgi:hypothetical protein